MKYTSMLADLVWLWVLVPRMYVYAASPTTLRDARNCTVGDTVFNIPCIVTSARDFRNISYVQDYTAGIAIYDTIVNGTIEQGDGILITRAVLAEFGASRSVPGSGQLQLTNVEYTRLSHVDNVYPTDASTSDIGEQLEGMLVRMSIHGFLDSGRFQGEFLYRARGEQQQTIPVWIDAATSIAEQHCTVPATTSSITGLLSQYKGQYQLLPRTISDIENCTSDTTYRFTQRHRNELLHVASWNCNWLGSRDSTRGPVDKYQQVENVTRVVDSLHPDIIALQEIASEDTFQEVVRDLGHPYRGLYPGDSQPTSQRMAFIYNTESIRPTSTAVVKVASYNDWGNGRYPYTCEFIVNTWPTSDTIALTTIHAKASSADNPYTDTSRRTAAASALYREFSDGSHKQRIIIGDFNETLPSGFAGGSYTSFIIDTNTWFCPTATFASHNLCTYIPMRSAIDHGIVTRSLRERIVDAIPSNPRRYISSYSTTTSDHLPISLYIKARPTPTYVEYPMRRTLPVVSTNNVADLLHLTACGRVLMYNVIGETLLDRSFDAVYGYSPYDAVQEVQTHLSTTIAAILCVQPCCGLDPICLMLLQP